MRVNPVRIVRKASAFKHSLLIRNMSTKRQFLVMVDDYPGTIDKRVEVRQQHLANVGKNPFVIGGGISLMESLLISGAYFSKDPTPEDPMPFKVGIQEMG